MTVTCTYASPLGSLLLAAEKEALTGLWLPGQKYYAAGLPEDAAEDPSHPVLQTAAEWLDAYFAGEMPDFTPPLALRGTPFQERVWAALMEIPRGQTATYGELAERLSSSARAVGGAVGKNPVSLIVPCHRVLGAGGRLTGYAAGLDKKQALLALEGSE